jgi:hypothetical protein
MKLRFKLLLLVAVLGVLAAGLLPPLLQQGYLRSDANDAAHAGVNELLMPGASPADVSRAIATSVASHHGVRLYSMKVTGGEVTVTLKQNVHTFMSNVPGLEGWFHLTVTDSASEVGSTS